MSLSSGNPETPYAGTSGWSGSDTSERRVRRDDSDGTTAAGQQAALKRCTWSPDPWTPRAPDRHDGPPGGSRHQRLAVTFADCMPAAENL